MSGWSHSAIDTRPTRLAYGAGRLGELQNPVGRERPDRQVVVAGPAEAAQVRASADDFDEEARSELGVGREDAGRRRIERVGRLDAPPCARAAAPSGPATVDTRSASRRRRTAARRTTGRRSRARGRAAAADRRGRSPRGTRARATGTSTSPSPAAMTSANGASGSGLTNVTAPPMTTSGCVRVALGGVRRDARPAGAASARSRSPTRRTRRTRSTSKSPTGVCDSSVTSGVLAASSSASSCFGGRNTRSQTMSSWALNRR